MPEASIVVPAYNVAHCIAETLQSLLDQSFADFEILVIDDGSTDRTVDVASGFDDPRIRILSQRNRGLAGARNSGIHAARGKYVAFCDADDLWAPQKLARHVAHFEADPELGLSYSASALIGADGRALGMSQRPRTKRITARHVVMRNPVGNGSAPVFWREALDDIAWRPEGETERDWWFDETFRQSEDIECWTRFALTTHWKIEGIAEDLTFYRIVPGGLSASILRQLESWERMAEKVTRLCPDFAAAHIPAARAYQLRYLARRAVSMGQGRVALRLCMRGMHASRHPLLFEPVKTLTTIAAALMQSLGVAAALRLAAPRLLPAPDTGNRG